MGRATLGLLRLPGAVAPATWAPPWPRGWPASRRRPGLLVLDDFQEVRDPGVADLLDALLQHPPPALRLVLATRVDPRLPLARLRARGQLAELRAADLRFSLGRGRYLPRPRAARTASPAAVARLDRAHRGLGRRPAPGHARRCPWAPPPPKWGDAIGRPAQALALEYLWTRCRPGSPRRSRRSCCGRRSPSVSAPRSWRPSWAAPAGAAARPAAGPAPRRCWRAWCRAGLFLTPLDELARSAAPARVGEALGTCIRLVPLPPPVPRPAVGAAAGPPGAGGRRRLHARAGAWFGAAGLVEDGLHHLQAAGDGAGAGALVEAHIHPALEGDGWPALERWLDLLPPAEGAGRPALAVARAWLAHRRGRFDALPGLLPRPRALLDAAPAGPLSERRALEGQLGRPGRLGAFP